MRKSTQQERNRKYYIENRESRLEYHRQYYLMNKKTILADKKNTKEKTRWRLIKQKYGMTSAEWQQLFDTQKGKCGICHEELLAGKKSHTDHDHNTGKVRGILCQPCNHALGLFKDNIVTLQSAINYIKGV
jgi:nitrate/TMAO reductase-like tetraheme cytochrome c subunit